MSHKLMHETPFKGSNWNFAWFTSTYISYSIMLFFMAVMRLIRVFLSKQRNSNDPQPRNWITAMLYIFITIDAAVGILLVLSVSLNPEVYWTGDTVGYKINNITILVLI